MTGTLLDADDEGITIRPDDGPEGEDRRLTYDQVMGARTLFEWATTTKPTTKKKTRT